MSHALANLPVAETKWTIVSGPMTGAVRLVNASEFVIGRSPDSDFIIANDPKCSRHHGKVTWSGDGCQITSLTENNPVIVNGKAVHRHRLSDGEVILIGSTEILFNLTTLPVAPNLDHRHLSTARSPGQIGMPSRAQSRTSRSRSSNKKSPLFMYIVVGLIIAVMYFAFSGTSPRKKILAIRGEQQAQEEIENANKLRESGEKIALDRVDNTANARLAQSHYVRGSRDFHKGQYERALDSFNTCLALNPEHILCNRYKLLASRKFNEIIQLQIVLGRRYRDQNQYKSCLASFRNVMVMIKDSNSAIYREAKANYDACSAFLEGRY